MGVGGCGQVWAYMSKSGQNLMGQTDQVGMVDMSIGWRWVCMQV